MIIIIPYIPWSGGLDKPILSARYVYVDMNRGSVSTIPIGTNESTPISGYMCTYLLLFQHNY